VRETRSSRPGQCSPQPSLSFPSTYQISGFADTECCEVSFLALRGPSLRSRGGVSEDRGSARQGACPGSDASLEHPPPRAHGLPRDAVKSHSSLQLHATASSSRPRSSIRPSMSSTRAHSAWNRRDLVGAGCSRVPNPPLIEAIRRDGTTREMQPLPFSVFIPGHDVANRRYARGASCCTAVTSRCSSSSVLK
jgi:hypothetical protein